jgi:tRNA A-37 threonylcarbamoyl transferase component Bud32
MNIGKFEIVSELGKGAMGTVYKARDPKLDREVALKTVAPGLLASKDAVARFRREARAAAKLQHPNIVTVYELQDDQEPFFIAMELLDGQDLSQVMAPRDRLPLLQKVRIMAEVCRALDYAHKQGVVHRDIKPANIRVRRDGSVKIVDFGIARTADSNMTQTGLVLGTPSYIAPEVLESGRVDHRADMWAVGVILYEMLSGRRPYEADTITSLVYRIVHEPLPPLDGEALGVPEPLLAVVRRALQKDPRERFKDMADMARALEEVIGVPSPPEALPPAARQRAYERNYAEARKLLAENDLEGALEAARRAQALDPSRTGIVALIKAIEEHLRSGDAVRRPPRRPHSRTADTQPSAVREPPPAVAPAVLNPPTLTDLRHRGASLFREVATFGEPPSTQVVSLSPVKDLLAAAGSDGAVRLWDLHSRTKVLTLRTEMQKRTGHDALALALAFSPDGKLLASGHVDSSVHLFDLSSGEEVPVKMRHDALVGALAFSPDGTTLASGSMDANVRLWDMGSVLAGQARRELFRQPSAVTALAWAGGGDWLVTGHTNRMLRLLDATSGRLLATLRGPEGQVNLLCLSPSGQHLAVASHDRTIRLIDLASRSQVSVLPGQRKPVTSLSFAREGDYLATVAQDNVAQLWDTEAATAVTALWGAAEESFNGVAVFGGGDHIAVALADGRIRIWGPA